MQLLAPGIWYDVGNKDFLKIIIKLMGWMIIYGKIKWGREFEIMVFRTCRP